MCGILNWTNWLAYLGAYVVIIEKEGIVQSLKPFADKYGVALLSSHGFLTEYAVDLSNLVKGVKGNVAILTDYDISGLLISLNIPSIHRIGIDLDTLQYFGFSTEIADLGRFDEGYTPKDSHWAAVIKHAQNKSALPEFYRDLLSQENLEYLRTRRIEISSVKTAVKNKGLWEFIMVALREAFGETDYTRAIDVEEKAKETWPSEVITLNRLIAGKVASIIQPTVDYHTERLQSYDGKVEDESRLSEEEKEERRTYGLQAGFIEVEYESAMVDDFNSRMDEDEDLGPVLKKVQALINKWQSGDIDADDGDDVD
jgi:hypothetical protein